MIINSVKLRNIRSYIEETVNFPEGAVMLSGDIGSGKSTILLALEFALFGIMRGTLDGEALLRNGKSSGSVEVCLEIDGKEIVIKRALKRGKDAVSQDSGYIIIDGKVKEATASELKAIVLGLLGYPKELLTKSKLPIYRYTVYTPQEEMKQILFEARDIRLDTLRKVFQVDKYKRIRENADIVARYLRELAKGLEGKTEDIEEKKKQRHQLDSGLKELRIKSRALEPELNKCGLLAREKRESLLSIEEKISNLNELRRRLEASSASMQEKIKVAENLSEETKQAEKKLAELIALIEKKTGIKDLIAARQNVSGKKLSAEKEMLKAKIAESEKGLASVNEALAKHSYAKEASEKLKEKVAELENCPTCLQPVTKEHKDRIHAEENGKIALASRAIEEKQRLKSESEKQISEMKKSYEQLLEQEKEVVALTYSIDLAEEKDSRCRTLYDRQAGLKKEITTLEEEKNGLADRIRNYSGVEELFKKTRAEFEQLQEKERSLMVSKAGLDAEIESLNRNLLQLEEEIAKKEEARKKLAGLKKLNEWLGTNFTGLMDSIEKSVMGLVHSEFNGMFQDWFNTLMEGAMSARLDEGFSPVIEQNGYEVSVENLSGGERTACALAYRLALNKVINDLITGIKTRDIIILDEPTDGFSSQQLEKVRDVIEQLGVKQTIIVSHEAKVESFVDSIIKIAKSEHISSVR